MTLREKMLDRAASPLVMGILNVTPDSFSDGGQYQTVDAIRVQLQKMVEAGVDIVDIGGESTRPGAESVSLQEELDRVLPAIEIAKKEFEIAVSIDTYKTEIMEVAIDLGVDLVNDINALRSDGAVNLISQSDVFVCLMHLEGQLMNMHEIPDYEKVTDHVVCFLKERVEECLVAGISSDRIILDPGFGFGKALEHNVELFAHLNEIISIGFPVLVGVSRKRMIGELLGGLATEKRMVGSVVAAALSAHKGAKIIRVHDVSETIQAIKILKSLM